MARPISIRVAAALLILSAQPIVAAENWPNWRGPRGTGVAADGEYATQFSSDDGLAWRVKLPGRGTSTPAVWGENIFVTCGIGEKNGIVCYSRDGKEMWRREFGSERTGKHRNASGSNPSPATDGRLVVAYFKSGELVCLDVAGNEKWRVNLQNLYGKDTLWWDLGTSPVLHGDRAIVAVMQEGDSYLAAFNVKDGSEAWKTQRTYETPEEADQAYSTPQIVQLDGRDVIVTWGADHLTGHDPTTGEQLWECGGFNPDNKSYWRVIASAAADDGMAVVPYGRGEFLAGIRLGGTGDTTQMHRVWEKAGRNLGSDVPTPVIKDGRAYVLTDAGRILCLDLKSGDQLWTADLPRNRNKYYASPVLAGDTMFLAREDGTVLVGRVTDDGFKLLNENNLEEQVIATPVPVDGFVLIRGEHYLYCVGPAETREARRGG